MHNVRVLRANSQISLRGKKRKMTSISAAVAAADYNQ